MSGTDFTHLLEHLDFLPRYGIPSFEICVKRDKEELLRRSGGSDRPPLPGALYYAYSVSKPVTSFAAMALVERGLLDLDAPVSDILPEFARLYVKDGDGVRPARTVLTVRHLFTMTSGFSYFVSSDCLKAMKAGSGGACPTRDAVRHFASLPLEFDPGERFMYGLSHDILAACAEVCSGMRYSEWVKKSVFGPLEMNDSRWGTDEEAASRLEPLYTMDSQMKTIRKISTHNGYVFGPEYESGGAGLISSLDDLSKFACAMARLGEGENGVRILKRETADLIRTDALNDRQKRFFDWTEMNPAYSYGLGMRTCVLTEPLHMAPVGEYGWSGAAGALILASPELGVSAVYLQHVLLCPPERVLTPIYRGVYGAFA